MGFTWPDPRHVAYRFLDTSETSVAQHLGQRPTLGKSKRILSGGQQFTNGVAVNDLHGGLPVGLLEVAPYGKTRPGSWLENAAQILECLVRIVEEHHAESTSSKIEGVV